MDVWRRRGWSRPGRRGRRATRALGAAAAGLLALALAIGLAAHAALRQGPVALPWLAERIEAAAARDLPPGARLTVGAAVLTLGDAGDPAPGLRLERVRLRGVDGARLAYAPRVRIDFQPLPLLAGRLRLDAVTVVEPRLLAARGRDGVLRLGLAEADAEAEAELSAPDDLRPPRPAPEAGEASLGAILAALAPEADGPFATLREAAVVGGRLRYDDAPSGRTLRAERADLSLARRDDGGFDATLSLAAPGDGPAPTLLRVEAALAPDGAARLRARFSGLAPADVAAFAPSLAGVAALAAPLQGRIAATLGADGAPGGVEAQLRVGAGTLALGDTAAPIEGADVSASFDPATDRLRVARLAARGGFGALSGAAEATLTRDARGGLTGAVVDLALDGLTVAQPGVFAAPQAFDAVEAALRVAAAPLRVEAASLRVERGALGIDARGAAEQGPDGWSARVEATGAGLDAATLAALWPPAAAPGARRWIAENLTAATVDRFDAAARVGPDGEAMALTFAFRDGVGHYFRPLPPIEGAAGWGQATLDAFTMTLDAGTVTPPGGGGVDLAGSVFTIPDLEHPQTPAEITVRGTGPIAAVLETLDFEPLGFVSKLGLDPRAVGGTVTAEARMALPLLRDLLLEQVAVTAEAQLAEVRLTAPDLPAPVEAEALALTADTERLRLRGPVRLAGATLEADWREVFAPAEGETRTALTLAGRVTAEQAAALGLDPRPHLDGAAGVTAEITRDAAEAMAFDVGLDLRAAALDAAPVDWRKAPGAAATARIAGGGAAGDIRLTRIALDAPDLSARGSARLGAGGRLTRLDLSRLRVGAGVDATLALAREGEGYAARIGGRLLDLSAFELNGGGPAPEAGPPLAAALELDALRLGGRLTLEAVTGVARRTAGGAVSAELSAQAGGPVRVRYAEQGGGAGTARVEADNAGALLRSMGVFPDGVGGSLAVDARLEGERVTGDLRIDGMTVAEDEALRGLISEAEIAAAPPGGLRFDRIRAPFTLEGDRLRLTEAVATGPSVGLSVSGEIDLSADRLDLTGVFSPAYALNSAVGAIPLIGGLLTGGEGRGVIAFNFAMQGPADDPSISVNPLSVLTPGVLRRIFEGGGAAPAQEGRDQR
jgi:hypothetical protein